jgi:hypothetical protein
MTGRNIMLKTQRNNIEIFMSTLRRHCLSNVTLWLNLIVNGAKNNTDEMTKDGSESVSDPEQTSQTFLSP